MESRTRGHPMERSPEEFSVEDVFDMVNRKSLDEATRRKRSAWFDARKVFDSHVLRPRIQRDRPCQRPGVHRTGRRQTILCKADLAGSLHVGHAWTVRSECAEIKKASPKPNPQQKNGNVRAPQLEQVEKTFLDVGSLWTS